MGWSPKRRALAVDTSSARCGEASCSVAIGVLRRPTEVAIGDWQDARPGRRTSPARPKAAPPCERVDGHRRPRSTNRGAHRSCRVADLPNRHEADQVPNEEQGVGDENHETDANDEAGADPGDDSQDPANHGRPGVLR